MVLSRSLWPIQCCTVRRSTPFRKQVVPNVARNLCRNQCSQRPVLQVAQCPQFRPARLATSLHSSKKLFFGLHPEVGKTRGQFVFASAWDFFSESSSRLGTGTSRSW